ncbi:MAG TPA: amine oxidase [Algoriphagus sp.]|jgi:protoporphyrinogen oxidase|uniref:NAD(P)/FAD-dependent oxidoreductase n=2 Tax=Algoriphagus TaxID=246875 RepID=UPI000C5ED09A|nr:MULTISPECIES: NAD(P)/FAD-dependent oxidoreductase [unclassified Algoriphagus]MAL13564.1 amine oxidase [Algoriphagus sp.]QYH38329.1 FAD-dependent oxidoreductase [Algoriphagus sp. NBT04N3]HAH38986.1 amine oxidase [Algoriphagus sp.]HCD88757.1 amine oxidase [Algoriphagus sp.]HCH44254.1 amine oxidase [Algoriphagus sp.]|tara:strand:+ start:13529 stop:14776 length:1248 start_codon:yes stop_codon:yes gene_type:complete
MKEEKIYIIGAGISGLIAALELEKAGFSPVILESSDQVGGRVKTDVVDGFLLDHGFQVLNTAYPEAKKYLDFQALHLKTFDPGAVILNSKESYIISDPMRNPLKIMGMVFSKVGTFLDKVKMFALTQELKKKTNEEIFNTPSLPTLQYLKAYGFSDQIITNFFIPFFRGVFLEKQLNTSSRMFEFVFKMFSLGHAAVPEKGMGEIPKLLRKQLSTTQIYFNTAVKEVQGNAIHLENGETLLADRIIIAVQPDKVMKQLQGQFAAPRKVINMYFSLQKSFLARPMIGLLNEGKYVNNIVFMDDVSDAYCSSDRSLLSVTVLESELEEKELVKAVQSELEVVSGIKSEYFKLIKTYQINYALPVLDDLKYTIPFTECKITDHVFLAGDYLLNGSINAAMTSGRIASEAVVHSYMPTH